MAKVTNILIPFDAVRRRIGNLTHLYADMSRAKSDLGLEPKYSDPEYIIKTAWNFAAKHEGYSLEKRQFLQCTVNDALISVNLNSLSGLCDAAD